MGRFPVSNRRATYESMLAELDARNRDNVTRTASYLELYAATREDPPELPWLLMAHLVSRNAGYLMTDLAAAMERPDAVFSQKAFEEMFLFLERANFLIFHDAWHHVLHHLLGRSEAVDGRTSAFMRGAWSRYEAEARGEVSRELERALLLDLVRNEQTLIEEHVVHAADFGRARSLVAFVEATGHERPIELPLTAARIQVGGFIHLERRITTGRRIFDEVLAPRAPRSDIFAWALERPHSGSRAVAGGKASRTLAEAWPLDRVRGLWRAVHDPPAPRFASA